MQGLLSEGYAKYADLCATVERPVWIAPVGPAFAKIHDDIAAAGGAPNSPTSLFYALYQNDGAHPSRLGTQLAAYVIYATLSGNMPVGLPVPSGMDVAQVRALQDAAAAAVFRSEVVHPVVCQAGSFWFYTNPPPPPPPFFFSEVCLLAQCMTHHHTTSASDINGGCAEYAET
jgi:hypothetical protein